MNDLWLKITFCSGLAQVPVSNVTLIMSEVTCTLSLTQPAPAPRRAVALPVPVSAFHHATWTFRFLRRRGTSSATTLLPPPLSLCSPLFFHPVSVFLWSPYGTSANK